MDRKYYFITGLPRAGSTLLVNLLNQHPDIYASNTSGLPELVRGVRDGWFNITSHQAMNSEQDFTMRKNTLRSLFDGYYAHREEAIIFDKSRAWGVYVNTLNEIFGKENVKFLACVRDMRAIVSSFEKLYRKTSALGNVIADRPIDTFQERIQYFTSPKSPIVSAYSALTEIKNRNCWDQVVLVPFEYLTSKPKESMEAVTNLLSLPEFIYNFHDIEQTEVEDDRFHGYKDLHKIRGSINEVKEDWDKVLGKEISDKLKVYNTFINYN